MHVFVRLGELCEMKRILGLDIARAVAILGMLADHFGPPWLMNWFQGWPSLMFAFLRASR